MFFLAFKQTPFDCSIIQQIPEFDAEVWRLCGSIKLWVDARFWSFQVPHVLSKYRQLLCKSEQHHWHFVSFVINCYVFSLSSILWASRCYIQHAHSSFSARLFYQILSQSYQTPKLFLDTFSWNWLLDRKNFETKWLNIKFRFSSGLGADLSVYFLDIQSHRGQSKAMHLSSARSSFTATLSRPLNYKCSALKTDVSASVSVMEWHNPRSWSAGYHWFCYYGTMPKEHTGSHRLDIMLICGTRMHQQTWME